MSVGREAVQTERWVPREGEEGGMGSAGAHPARVSRVVCGTKQSGLLLLLFLVAAISFLSSLMRVQVMCQLNPPCHASVGSSGAKRVTRSHLTPRLRCAVSCTHSHFSQPANLRPTGVHLRLLPGPPPRQVGSSRSAQQASRGRGRQSVRCSPTGTGRGAIKGRWMLLPVLSLCCTQARGKAPPPLSTTFPHLGKLPFLRHEGRGKGVRRSQCQ